MFSNTNYKFEYYKQWRTNMKTPKEYRDNLLNHIITKQMLVDCLYSVNKRAKNYRDKERE